MKKKSATIIFFGNERLATGVTTTAPTLRRLVEAGYEVAAVVSNFTEVHSRNARKLEIEKVAAEYSIPFLLPRSLLDIKSQLESFRPDVGVLVAYGKMVPQAIIDIFPKGIVNIHPSLLPLHRGPTPIESVILDGDRDTGVSLMQLVKAMDAGPVFAQETIKLRGSETKQQLNDQLLERGGALLIDLLPAILHDTLPSKLQDNTKATYDERIEKRNGIIDWHKRAETLEREIRAYTVWPQSHAILDGKEIIITKARAVPGRQANAKPGDIEVAKEAGIIMVATGSGSLCIEQLKPPGKREMSASAFLAGYGKMLTG